jgi:hypothetical protein
VANPARLVSELRGKGCGAVLLAFFEGVPLIEVYNFLRLNNLPEVLWRGLDPDRIAVDCGASLVILNGSRYWLIDRIGKIDPVEPLVRDFGGIEMRRVAVLGVERTLNEESPCSFDGRLELPTGWWYTSRTLHAELVINITAGPATVLQDELPNTYSLFG